MRVRVTNVRVAVEVAMLELRPTCEHCERSLPPASTEARICSYECTFCSTCVEEVLQDVCPNCGGGFTSRPIRPTGEYLRGLSLLHQPATQEVTHKPVDLEAQMALIERLGPIPPERR